MTAPPIDKEMLITIWIYNQYSRPASNVSVIAAAIIIPSGNTPHFDRLKRVILSGGAIPRENGINANPIGFINAAKQPIGPLTATLAEDIKLRRVQAFVYGDIEFHDAAGCHRQQFCFRFDPTIRTQGPNTVPTGNWMDDPRYADEIDCIGGR
jgi:hypothetical protein